MFTETIIFFQPVAISTVLQEKPLRLQMSLRASDGLNWCLSSPKASVTLQLRHFALICYLTNTLAFLLTLLLGWKAPRNHTALRGHLSSGVAAPRGRGAPAELRNSGASAQLLFFASLLFTASRLLPMTEVTAGSKSHKTDLLGGSGCGGRNPG